MKAVALITACALSAAAHADNFPANTGMPMKHIEVSLAGNAISLHIDDPDEVVEMWRFPGEQYTGAAGALEDTWYADRYGWLPQGFITLEPDRYLWIEQVAPVANLETYEGGMRLMKANHTYAPIFGTDGSDPAWRWDSGAMTHHWVAATAAGDYDVAYSVFVGDALGNPDTSYAADQVTLHFTTVPAPAGALTLLGAPLVLRRRRGVC